MSSNDLLAAIARDLNATPDAGLRASQYRALIEGTNRQIREAADERLSLDATTLSFEAYKASISPDREA